MNRKRFRCGGCCRRPGQRPRGERVPRCCAHLERQQDCVQPNPQPLLARQIPGTWCTLWERYQKAQPAQLLQEGVRGLMLCNTQEVKKSISSEFFFKLHIISTPSPWTFAIEIEAHLDLVFWSETRGKGKQFLLMQLSHFAGLQMGLPHPPRCFPASPSSTSGGGRQEPGGTSNVN